MMEDIYENKRIELEASTSLKDMFDVIAQNGSNIAALYQEGEKLINITYSQMAEYSKNVAFKISETLKDKEKGRYIALKKDTCPKWPIMFWGILMAGFKPVLLDFRLNESMTEYMLKQCAAVAVISDSEKCSYDGVTYIPSAEVEKMADAECKDVPSSWQAQWADEVGFCTSGTTSTSKIFCYNGQALSRYLLNIIELFNVSPDFKPNKDTRSLAFLPFNHIWGFEGVFLPYSTFGCTIVYLKDRSPSTVLKTSQDLKVTDIYGVPLLFNNLAAGLVKKIGKVSQEALQNFNVLCDKSIELQRDMAEGGREYVSKNFFKDIQKELFGENIKILACGGGRAPNETLRILSAIGYNVVCGYGMTETGVASCGSSISIDDRLNGSLGPAFKELEYKLVSEDNNKNVGELYIKGSCLHTAMMKNGECLKPIVGEDGWFASGDIASMEDGKLRLLGRLKEVIVNESGENVYPDEVEDCFSSLKHVDQICIVGIKNNDGYEDITLVLHVGKNYDNTELINGILEEVKKINGSLSIYKRVKKVLVSPESLPSVGGMKTQRQKLKQIVESEHRKFINLEMGKSNKPVNSEINDSVAKTGDEDECVNKIKDEIRKCIADIIGLSIDEVEDDAHIMYDLGADSLQVEELRSVISEKYNVEIPEYRFFECTNVNELSALIVEQEV